MTHFDRLPFDPLEAEAQYQASLLPDPAELAEVAKRGAEIRRSVIERSELRAAFSRQRMFLRSLEDRRSLTSQPPTDEVPHAEEAQDRDTHRASLEAAERSGQVDTITGQSATSSADSDPEVSTDRRRSESVDHEREVGRMNPELPDPLTDHVLQSADRFDPLARLDELEASRVVIPQPPGGGTTVIRTDEVPFVRPSAVVT